MIVEQTTWAAVPPYAVVVALDGRQYVVVPHPARTNPERIDVSVIAAADWPSRGVLGTPTARGWVRWYVDPRQSVAMLVPELGDAIASLTKHFKIEFLPPDPKG